MTSHKCTWYESLTAFLTLWRNTISPWRSLIREVLYRYGAVRTVIKPSKMSDNVQHIFPHFWITISSFRMFSNVGKSIVLLCQQTMRPNTRMLSEIEKIIIKDKGKIYNKLKIDPSAYIFVFVLTFLCHKVTHVLFSGWGHIPPHLILIHMPLLMLVVRTANQ